MESTELHLDLYLPTGCSNAPLVVWIHGGGWREGSKAVPPIRRLVDEGFAIASISHRFSQQAIFPAQIHDCKAAVRWLRAHQHVYGYQADWIAAVGGSSGGHLALLLGLTAGQPEMEGTVGNHHSHSSAVQAVVDYFGPTDFILRAKTQPDIIYTEKVGSYALLGGLRYDRVDAHLERWASPAEHVTPNAPPLLVFHGSADELVLPDQSERIVAAYRHHGLEAELIMLPGAGHGGVEFFWGENFGRLVNFLKQHSGLPR